MMVRTYVSAATGRRPGEGIVIDRFHVRTRHVMSLAWQLALELRQNAIGTEHVLLALIDEGGASSQACIAAGATREAVYREIELATPPLEAAIREGQLPFMPRSKTLLEKALDAAQGLGHDHIASEHLLVGLLRADRWPSLHPRNSVSRKVMKRLGVDTAALEDRVLEELRAAPPE